MRVRLESIGCRLNIGEIEAIARDLISEGHRIVGPGESADLCVFNSCTVTATASRKSRQVIRQLRRANPKATIVATGCYSELEPLEIRALGVDLVVSNHDKDRLAEVLREQGVLGDPESVPVADADDILEGYRGRTRAFLKVQDGCDNRCSFCVVTVARGAGRSKAEDEVVAEVQRILGLGYREVVLSGVHLGSYGHDQGKTRGLEALVERILSETELLRLRLSSIEPWALDRKTFGLFDDRRLLPHLHIPLQSGCDDTLRRMARRTDRRSFAGLVAAARSAIPKLSITTDIIVGFPGESDDEFEQSIDFVETMAFSRLHVFRYSPRKGTPAATMANQVAGGVAQERSRRMQELGARLEERFHRSFVGASLPVLWEQSEAYDGGRRWSGLTDNYIRTVMESASEIDLTNRVTETRLLATVPGGVLGEVVETSDAGL